MMITAVTKRGGRSAIGSMLASTGTFLLRKRFPAKTPQEQQQEVAVAPNAELQMLGFQKFIERTRSATLVELLRIKLGFPREVFERAVSPVIEGYVEFVQLPPTSESQQHGNPEEFFTRALEVANRALDYRRGQILPRGAAPEVIGAQAHRWTYAVFVAALLCDVGKNSLDVHERRAAQLFNRLVPPSVLEWLAADPAVMRELLAFLSGDISARSGAISQLVLRAAAESGGRDHLRRGRADLSVQEASPAANSRDVKVVCGFEGRSTSSTTLAAQPDAATTATIESAPRDEETEYLEDFEEGYSGRAEQFRTADPALAQTPDAARRFIGWVRQELSDGALRVNEAGALVHFVEEGMLLVSPRIFREFAKRFGEDGSGCGPANSTAEPDIGKSVQRQVLRAGWHLRADKGVNILTYQVMRGNGAVSRLSGVVIRNPARFVNPVRPINPLLVRLRQEHGDA